jgi:DUF917 family protein
MSDDARTIGPEELPLILQGACFLGSGGGGPLTLGEQFIEDIRTAPHPVRVVDPATVPASAAAAISAGVGSPVAAAGNFPADAPRVAWSALQEAVGHGLDVVVPAEIGAGNTFVPFLLSAQTGLPVIDGAGADRAVPALQLCTFAAAGVPLGSVVLGNATLVLRFEVEDPVDADAAMRALLGGGVFAEDAGSAMWSMTGTDVARAAVPRTTTRALEVGSLLHTSSDPVEDVATYLGGRVLVRGTITDIGEATAGGFDTGHVTITSGVSREAVTVLNVNENLVAFSGQSPTVLATAPDLLCYVTATGQAFSNAEAAGYRESGDEVALVVVPSSAPMRAAYLRAAFSRVLASVGYFGPLVLLGD